MIESDIVALWEKNQSATIRSNQNVSSNPPARLERMKRKRGRSGHSRKLYLLRNLGEAVCQTLHETANGTKNLFRLVRSVVPNNVHCRISPCDLDRLKVS